MSKRRSLLSFLLAIGATPLLFGSAFASDGVFEINHICAVQTGCSSDDAPGYPVLIAAAGSYQLTSDLEIPNENTNGIFINTSNASLNLNNFRIVRKDCVNETTNCTPTSGVGSGITVSNLSLTFGNTVHSGSITGMGDKGVIMGEQSEIRNLRVRWNRLGGIRVTDGAEVTGNTVYQNGTFGIDVGDGSTVSGNTVYQSEANGIQVGNGATVSGNTTSRNGDHGIKADSGATVLGNTAFSNGGHGILVSEGSMVQGNTVRSNTGFGLSFASTTGLASDAAYVENVITNNAAGTVSNVLGVFPVGFNNSCNSTPACP